MPFKLRWLGLSALTLVLMGCKSEVLDPAGPVALEQRDLLISSTLLMLIIIIPVMVLTVWFAWVYRAGNKAADYRPNWDHSTKLELVIWAAPLFIIISLGALTWVGTHMTDPYRPLAEDGKGQSLEGVEPLNVQVVALDWKWLFILPEEGVASVNELAVPVGRPVEFHLTSDSVMNAFYIPAMAGMIYAMPGMQTELNGLFDHAGTFQGTASHYSGAGFSGMKFKVHALDDKGFADWVAKAKQGAVLDSATYLALAEKSEKNPVAYYGQVEEGLFARAVNLCVIEGKMCQAEMMALDMKGGTGVATPLASLPGRNPALAQAGFVTGVCTVEELLAASLPERAPIPRTEPLLGHGLTLPGAPNPLATLPLSPSDL
ncbi:ubiquinol oxidase subunit II [Stagnihabitans tardus]|uniref:Ubiquinol oxidase polypeptide II n=1 Tax=Stagnihabitans tardus TaxID=2699202 RepID=A0AAE4YDR4_9RHOB|nr:ubiquinol oxidase subunit II [Stagnihabitans tardus]NBZ87750.1 ubiquinol oxidase subunit II [Stagnihabitans tardus]